MRLEKALVGVKNNITYNGIKYNEWIKSNEFLVQFSKEEEQSSLFDVDEDETYIFIQEGTTTEEIIDAMKELDELLAYGTEDAKDYAARCARLKQVYSKFNQEITLPSSEKEAWRKFWITKKTVRVQIFSINLP